jgi:pimeloyl-ACP methyl ester carboxylesterase
MQTLHVNGTDMAYLEVGDGSPLVCVHGSLGDFRTWSPVLGPLSKKHRVIAISLRHFFPEHWDGVGDTYSIAQHVANVIGFIEKLDAGPVDLMGHSRGGHISFRAAQRRPDLLRRLVLVEPGGELDASLDPAAKPGPSQFSGRFAASAERISAAISMAASNSFSIQSRVTARGRGCPRHNGSNYATTPLRRSVRSGTSGRPTPAWMPSRSGCRRFLSTAPTPKGCFRKYCMRWRRTFRIPER